MPTLNILPSRRKRSEAFFGIHFDFHADMDCDKVGKNVTKKSLLEMLDRVQPDFIQCDCKGHPGVASYPTKIGTPAPGFVKDQLKLWRQATAERGVSLYMHYSGVIDRMAVKQHPTWAARDQKGKPDERGATSVFGPYLEKLMIPMLKEIIDEYGVDGIWVDGECWGVVPDYSSYAKKAWKAKTGKDNLPMSSDDSDWQKWLAFHRDGFRAFLKRYVDEMHAYMPDFEIASNWAYSGHMPEKVKVKVDFISGDFTPMNAFNRARLEARILASQGKPWDLMAWSFNARWGEPGRSTKKPVQLQQEAAAVMSLGGGFQAYFKQKRDGSIFPWTIKLMEETAKFCRAREAYCHQAEAIPQVGLILSTDAYYRHNDALLFRPWSGVYTPMQGVLQALLDGQNSVEVVMEHNLEERINEYPLLVWPEWSYIKASFKKKLIAYVKAGGKLLVIGAKAMRLFKAELKIDPKGQPETRAAYTSIDGWMGGANTTVQEVSPKPGVKKLGWLYEADEESGPRVPAAISTKLGKGTIVGITMDMGERYCTGSTTVARDFLDAMVTKLMPEPVVTIKGSRHIDIALNRVENLLCVQLVNTFAPHGDENNYTYDEIPAIGPLTISIQLKAKPREVRIEPESRQAEYSYRNGRLDVIVPRVEIHEILCIEL